MGAVLGEKFLSARNVITRKELGWPGRAKIKLSYTACLDSSLADFRRYKRHRASLRVTGRRVGREGGVSENATRMTWGVAGAQTRLSEHEDVFAG